MRTLIITNSFDATSDLLILKMGSEKFVRINYDRPQDWEIIFNIDRFTIKSNLGEFSDKDIAKCFWRKPFISSPLVEPFNEKFYAAEFKYFIYELTIFMHEQGKLRFNLPSPDYLLGKIKQQRHAKKYLRVPDASLYLNVSPNTKQNKIAKSISAEQFSDGNVLYTVDVSNQELSPDLWFIQDKVNAKFDMTVVHAYGKNFAFQLDRSNLSGMDWRKEQLDSIQLWEKYDLTTDLTCKINSFMNDLGLVYGRLDFMNDPEFDEPYFLEVNKNGQWAWLDPTFNNGLFQMMCDIVDPSTD